LIQYIYITDQFQIEASSGGTQTNLFTDAGPASPMFPVQSTKQDVFGGLPTTSIGSVFGGQQNPGFGGTGSALFGASARPAAEPVFPVHTTKKDIIFGSSETTTTSPIFGGQSRPISGFSGSGPMFGGVTTSETSSNVVSSGIATTRTDKNTTQPTNLFGGQVSGSDVGTTFSGAKSASDSSNKFVSTASVSLFGGKLSEPAYSSKSLKVDVTTATAGGGGNIYKTLSPPSTTFITCSSQTTPTSSLSGTTDTTTYTGVLFGGD